MRLFGFALAAAAAVSWCVPASAATMVTTSYYCTGSDPCVGLTALQPFDSSLGTLTGIDLKIDASVMLSYTFWQWDADPFGAHLVL